MRQQQPDPVMTAVGAVDDRVRALTGAIREMVICECLVTTTLQISATGHATFDWSQRFASVAVTNPGTDTITVTTATPADAAPTHGIGVALVPPGKGAVHNFAGHCLTLYGTPGDVVTVSVFSRPQPPAWG